MAMKLIKKTDEYKIYMRGDDRYAVQDASGKPVNGEEKVRILVAEDLIKVTLPSPKEETEEAEEAVSDEATEAAAEVADVDEVGEAEGENADEPEPEPEPEEPASDDEAEEKEK